VATVVCVSNVEGLRTAIEHYSPSSSQQEAAIPTASSSSSVRTFIALWSFSESPRVLRNQIVPLLQGFDRFFVGYQPNFEGVKSNR
jgi:hypothetical protein